MVRLVFRPYTQVWRSICTSEPLRTSTRVSSGFVLLEHSSPSFGSQHLRSFSTQRTNRIDGTILRLDRSPGSYLILRKQSLLLFRLWVYHPITRAHVRLLGPCFKTGEISGHHGHRRSFVVSRSSSKSNQVATAPASKNGHFDQPNDEISRVLRRLLGYPKRLHRSPGTLVAEPSALSSKSPSTGRRFGRDARRKKCTNLWPYRDQPPALTSDDQSKTSD